MTPDPYLSLVVPVHRGAAFIERNVRTILETLEQLGRPFEVIVVIDGDLDRTSAAVGRVQDERVRAFQYPQNQGKGFAISFGCAQAQGRLVGWLDADLDITADAIIAAARCFESEQVDAAI